MKSRNARRIGRVAHAHDPNVEEIRHRRERGACLENILVIEIQGSEIIISREGEVPPVVFGDIADLARQLLAGMTNAYRGEVWERAIPRLASRRHQRRDVLGWVDGAGIDRHGHGTVDVALAGPCMAARHVIDVCACDAGVKLLARLRAVDVNDDLLRERVDCYSEDAKESGEFGKVERQISMFRC